MARKNIFASVMLETKAADVVPAAGAEASNLPKFGAAKSLSSSIDALARQAQRLVEGEAIVELDPALVDASFLADRMTVDDQSYQELLAAIRERGQDSPVLVRPHPTAPGRYQVVFGHRRLKVARELGKPLKAVVKTLADIEHVLAQGQENSARANLSFIEKVLFAQRLANQNYAREVIQSALSVDYQTLSKMLTIPKVIGPEVIEAIGPARGIGRDRWLELRKLMEGQGAALQVGEALQAEAFKGLDSPARFDFLFHALSAAHARPRAKKALPGRAGLGWVAPDSSVQGSIRRNDISLTLVLKSKAGTGFGDYVTQNLDRLYAEFQTKRGG